MLRPKYNQFERWVIAENNTTFSAIVRLQFAVNKLRKPILKKLHFTLLFILKVLK